MSRVGCDEPKQQPVVLQRGLVKEGKGGTKRKISRGRASTRAIIRPMAHVLALKPHNRGSAPYTSWKGVPVT